MHPRKAGDVVGFDGADCGPAEVLIQKLETGLYAGHDVGSVFALVHAPVVAHAEGAIDETEAFGAIVDCLRYAIEN